MCQLQVPFGEGGREGKKGKLCPREVESWAFGRQVPSPADDPDGCKSGSSPIRPCGSFHQPQMVAGNDLGGPTKFSVGNAKYCLDG